MTYVICNAILVGESTLTPDGWLLVRDGRIAQLGSSTPPKIEEARYVDAQGMYLAPGFVDLHVHGGGGGDFSDASRASAHTALCTHLLGGTTTIVPTLMTSGPKRMLANLQVCSELMQTWRLGQHAPHIAGIHLEGPYISKEQLGAQVAEFAREPSVQEYMHVLDAYPNIIRWAAACELPGALEFGRTLQSRGITACIGHSNATLQQTVQAALNGYRCVTHLYSSCSMVHRNGPFREGGVVEATFLLDELDVEIIGDGIHLPPEFIKLIYKIKGPEHIALITDCIRPGGQRLPEHTRTFSDREQQRPVIVESGVAIMPDYTCFAGSIATMAQAVRMAVQEAGIPLCEAVQMASLSPARMLAMDGQIGSLVPGKRADVVLLDQDLQVCSVFLSSDEMRETELIHVKKSKK